MATLKAQLAEQQKQIDQLKLALEDQKKLIEKVASAAPAQPGQDTFALPRDKALGDVASTTPIIPSIAPAAKPALERGASPQPRPATRATAPPDTNAVPPYLRFGSVCITPVGFMDATFVWRDKNAASGIGSNFGSIPYNNVVNGKLSEVRFSPQNSRIGFRVDGDWKGAHFIGYNEFDFLGTSGSNAITVTNGAFVPRLRLYWVDVRKGGWEFLAGQSWSMLTPNRIGISPLPGDLFYSQVMDVNYMAGLTWTRQPGMRVLYHAGDKVTFGFSAREPRPVHWWFRRRFHHRPAGRLTAPVRHPAGRRQPGECGAPAHSGLHRQDRIRPEFALSRRSRRNREHLQNHESG